MLFRSMLFYVEPMYASTPQASIGWGTWLSDITQGINNTSNNSALFHNTHIKNPNMFVYEDTQFNVMYGLQKQNGAFQRATATQNYNYGNTYPFTTYVVDWNPNAGNLFFIGVDQLGFTYWLGVLDNTAATPYYIYKVDPRNYATTVVINGQSSQSSQNFTWLRSYPSNIRKDANNRFVRSEEHTSELQSH